MSNDFTPHLFTYRFDGAEWGFEIMAQSPEDAKARLKALAWAHYDGELVMRVPIPFCEPLVRLLRWWRRINKPEAER